MSDIIGSVIDTFSAKKGQSGLPRPKVEKLNLILDFGIEEDKFSGDDLNRTVMIVGNYTYNVAKENGMDLELGSLGENILFDFNPHDYEVGTQFAIGDTVIEITENCTICSHLAVFGKGLPKLVKECRGLYCKIVKAGEIKKDLPVVLVKEK